MPDARKAMGRTLGTGRSCYGLSPVFCYPRAIVDWDDWGMGDGRDSWHVWDYRGGGRGRTGEDGEEGEFQEEPVKRDGTGVAVVAVIVKLC